MNADIEVQLLARQPTSPSISSMSCDFDELGRIEHRRRRNHWLIERDAIAVTLLQFRTNHGVREIKVAQLLQMTDLDSGASLVDFPDEL